MNTKTQTIADTSYQDIALAAFFGIAILFIAGFANSASLHDAAHDTRHAIGFACH